MTERLRVVSRLEFIVVARLRWIRLLAAAFALLTIGAAWSAGSARELMGVDGFARTTVVLVPLVLTLVPLAAILLGVSGQTSEPGGEAFLHTQPVTRFEALLARYLGQAAALGCALLAGFGIGGLVVALGAGAADVTSFAVFAAATFGLALVFLALGALLAAVIERRTAALAAGAFVWFFFVLLFDAIALSSAMWLTGRAGARVRQPDRPGARADAVAGGDAASARRGRRVVAALPRRPGTGDAPGEHCAGRLDRRAACRRTRRHRAPRPLGRTLTAD
jgi:Cu-processing system permease protein